MSRAIIFAAIGLIFLIAGVVVTVSDELIFACFYNSTI